MEKCTVGQNNSAMTTAEIEKLIQDSEKTKGSLNEMLILSRAKDQIAELSEELSGAQIKILALEDSLNGAKNHIEFLANVIGEKERVLALTRQPSSPPVARQAKRTRG